MPLKDSATEAKLWLDFLLNEGRDRNGDPIQWTEGGKRAMRKLIEDLTFDLSFDELREEK